MLPAQKLAARQNEKVSGTKSRILIVDDHEILRDGMRLMIENQPDLTVCGEAEDQPSAIRLFGKMRPDAAVVDIGLKTGNGIELLKRIKTVDPGARILVYSMHEEEVYAERALRAGAMGYLTKQKPARAILQALRNVLQGKMHFSQDLIQRLLRAATGGPAIKESLVTNLSDRELEVFEMIGQGLSTRSIADRLHLSPRTIDTYRERLKQKLMLGSAVELHYRAVQWALEAH